MHSRVSGRDAKWTTLSAVGRVRIRIVTCFPRALFPVVGRRHLRWPARPAWHHWHLGHLARAAGVGLWWVTDLWRRLVCLVPSGEAGKVSPR